MGFPKDATDFWRSRTSSIVVPSPRENTVFDQRAFEEEKIKRAKRCTDEGVRAGFKAAVIAAVASAVPTLIGVRVIPWAKANLNYTAQALIISGASVGAYFIVAEKTILECSRRNTIDQYDKDS
eukprot:TRINITY_DN23600_c0_g1_i1.p1 TRINITY_DN23600_c0_g1~~TRINITY_DN23600_c0_g1_i1.p1  ORF type:complete len:124 (-),score=10.89 TRINITY_DN23600_c0_g1_i1:221-592(-)